MTNKDLQELFDYFNERFFEDRVRVKVRFGKIKEDGLCDTEHITISDTLKRHPDLIAIVLLHEMTHGYLNETGYVGHEQDGGHSTLFHAEIDRLYRAGAYEGLL